MIAARRSLCYASGVQAELAVKQKADRSYLDHTVNEFRVARRLCEMKAGAPQPKSLLLLVATLLDRKVLKITVFGGVRGTTCLY